MPIPGVTLSIQDPGLGLVDPATTVPLFYGYSSLGTNNALKTYSSVNDLVAGQGQGAAVEDAATVLAEVGGPIRFMKAATTVSGANSAVTPSGAGPTVSVAGTPNDNYEVTITIKAGGALGVGTFTYSLDNTRTPSETLTIPSGGTFVLANTGLTLTFASGTYVALDTYTFTSTAPMWNSTDLAAAFTALQADPTEWDFFVGCGRHATGAAAATIAAALETQLNTMANTYFRPCRGMMDAGDEATSAIITAFASTTGKRILLSYRSMVRNSAKPYAGWAVPKRRVLGAFAERATKLLPSTDLGRVASGPINGVFSIEHNEAVTEVMDAQRFATLRTIPGYQQQFFITRGRLKCPAGSDFQDWQLGRLMDIACRVVYQQEVLMLNSGFRTNPNGTIDDRDASRWETRIIAALRQTLMQPLNEEGVPGHVSGVFYHIDRDAVILSTSTIISEVAIQPLAYGRFISTKIGFAANLPVPVAA